ncbi:DMT family transporter [Magnetovibrio sp. PR-2]|uniref:DMT family transporter n=1 Tax=Magnetovibrio sp. PR-2 TaxID=3120356 RepID=UPI002FCE5855
MLKWIMFKNVHPAVLLTLSALFWGGNFVVGRWASTDIPPLNLTFWRWLVAGLILLPFVAVPIWRNRALLQKHLLLLIVLAVTGMVMFHSFTYIALNTTTAINAAVVLASMPIVIPVVSVFISDERLSARQALGIVISVLGVVVIVSRGSWDVLVNLSFAPGDLWVLASVVAWSVYSVLLRRLPKGKGQAIAPMVMLGASMWIAILVLLPLYLWEFREIGGFELNPSSALVIAYVAIFASIAAFVCWNAGVLQVGANKAGLFIHLIPLFASIFSIIFLGESLETYHFIGIAPIIAGILLTTTAKTTAAQPVKDA